MELSDIYRTFYPAVAEYLFFSSTYETFFRIGYMFSHKTSLNKFEKNKIIFHVFMADSIIKKMKYCCL